jgi:hypothetical protein
MSTMTFGRVGLTAAYGGDDYSMHAPASWSQQGRTVTLQGLQRWDSPSTGWEDLVAWRDGLLGYDPSLNGGDEAVIPITVPDVGYLDGFYRVVNVAVDLPPGALGTAADPGFGAVPWSAVLERVGHSTVASHEALTVYAVRANSHSITAGNYLAAVPSTATWTFPREGTRSVGDTGKALAYYVTAGSTAGTISHRYDLDAYAAYVGSARIEWAPGGTHRPVTGRRSFGPDAGLRLANGLVRCSIVSISGGRALEVAWWDGTQWDPAGEFEVLQTTNALGGANPMEALVSSAVLRNSPEECTVRHSVEFGGLAGIRTALDVTVTRGSRWVQLTAHNSPSVVWKLQAQSAFAAASTSITGGLARTSNLNGNRWILAGPAATVKDTTLGAVTNAAASSSASFGIGCEIGGTSATGYDDSASQIDEYYRVVSETVRVQDF